MVIGWNPNATNAMTSAAQTAYAADYAAATGKRLSAVKHLGHRRRYLCLVLPPQCVFYGSAIRQSANGCLLGTGFIAWENRIPFGIGIYNNPFSDYILGKATALPRPTLIQNGTL